MLKLSDDEEFDSDGRVSDKKLYDTAVDFAVKQGYVSQSTVSYIDLALGLHKHSAKIQAFYQYHDTVAFPTLNPAGDLEAIDKQCASWIYYNGKSSCDSDTVFALETKSSGKDDDKLILPYDRVFGKNPDAPIAILYADISDKSFAIFNKHLHFSAESGKIRYIVRYRKPMASKGKTIEKQDLAGYGVELYIKRTDYLVIDDRDVKQDGAEADENIEESKVNKGKIELKAVDEGASLSKKSIPLLGYRAAGYIMHSENKFDSLVNVSLDFPKYSYSVSELVPDRELGAEIKENEIQPGANILYINGAPISTLQDDIFSIVNTIDRERSYLSRFEDLGIKASDAIKLITYSGAKNEVIDETLKEEEEEEENDNEGSNGDDFRYDYRSPAIIWLNDLTTDSQYSHWSPSIENFLEDVTTQLHQIAHNAHTLVFAFDPSNDSHIKAIRDIFTILQKNIPIQIGLVPVVSNKASEITATQLYAVYDNAENRRGLIMFLINIIQGTDHSFAFKSHVNHEKYINYDAAAEDESISELIQEGKELSSRLDLGQVLEGNPPSVIANGIFVLPGQTWFQEMLKIFVSDSGLVKEKLINGEIEPEDQSIVLKDVFLKHSADRRNSLVTPESKSVQYNDAKDLYDVFWNSDEDANQNHVASFYRTRLPSNTEDPDFVSTIWIFGNSHSSDFLKQVIAGLGFIEQSETTTRLNIVPFTSPKASRTGQQQSKSINQILYYLSSQGADSAYALETVSNIHTALYGSSQEKKDTPTLSEIESKLAPDFGATVLHYDQNYDIVSNMENSEYKEILESDVAVYSSGRIISIPEGRTFDEMDLQLLQSHGLKTHVKNIVKVAKAVGIELPQSDGQNHASFNFVDRVVSLVAQIKFNIQKTALGSRAIERFGLESWNLPHSSFEVGSKKDSSVHIVAIINPLSEKGQVYTSYLKSLIDIPDVWVKVILNPLPGLEEIPLKRFYRSSLPIKPHFDENGFIDTETNAVVLSNMPQSTLMSMDLDVPSAWISMPKISIYDLDNIVLDKVEEDVLEATYELKYILIEGHATDVTLNKAPRGVQLNLGTQTQPHITDTIIMENLGYLQLKAGPGLWKVSLKEGLSSEIFNVVEMGLFGGSELPDPTHIWVTELTGTIVFPKLVRKKGKEDMDVLGEGTGLGKPGRRQLNGDPVKSKDGKNESHQKWLDLIESISRALNERVLGFIFRGREPTTKIRWELLVELTIGHDNYNLINRYWKKYGFGSSSESSSELAKSNAEINIFSVASGHLYERFLSIMTLTVMQNTDKTVKFWIIENFLSPKFKDFLPYLAEEQGFEYELVTYKWPHWLRQQTEKQRTIWGYKILFLDVLFPQSLDKIIFVDADQIVRTDLKELVDLDLEGAPYGFTPMCDSRKEIEGFRFWKQGYWKNYLGKLKYHISALYVVDLIRFRELAAGDMLRHQYQMLSADPGSLSNLDQDLPNHLQRALPIFSLPQDWLWCETWCSDESLLTAKTIDLCNNPMTKEPKLDRARRQIPEWTSLDAHVAQLDKKVTKILNEKRHQLEEEDYEDDVPELVDDDSESSEDEFSEVETEFGDDEDNIDILGEDDDDKRDEL